MSSTGREDSISAFVDGRCDQFERHLQSGENPPIEEFLEGATEPDLSLLLSELVALELEYRRKNGHDTDVSEYVQRFPDHQETLEKLSQDDRAAATVGFPACDGERLAAPAPEPQTADEPHTGDDSSTAGESPARREFDERFKLIEQVGRGAFGTVHRAYDRRLNATVAVKLPHAAILQPEIARLFEREAQAAAQLEHPHIVRVYNVGDRRLPYIVTEFVEGRTLKVWMADAKPAPRESAAICAKIAAALHYGHVKGVVHRDVKPSNIMIDSQGEPRIADFGLAKYSAVEETLVAGSDAADASTSISFGQVVGTPAYMSPEQADGDSKTAGPQSDVYSLGSILYEMLTQQTPFIGSVDSILSQLRTLPPQPLRKFNADIPPELEAICLKALAKNPAERYRRADDFAEDLTLFLAGESTSVMPHSWHKRARRIAGRLARGWALTAALAIIGVLAIVFLMQPPPDPPEHEIPPGPPIVLFDTEPKGAEITIIPRDKHTGRLKLDEIRKLDGKTPLRAEDVKPGHYLVVAVLPDNPERFQEVLRRVRDKEETTVYTHRHVTSYVLKDGSIRLPSIRLPSQVDLEYIQRQMVRVPAGGDFSIQRRGQPRAAFQIPGFLVDSHEVRADEFRRVIPWKQGQPPQGNEGVPDDHACPMAYHHAVAYAEATFKRLPDQLEWRYLATQFGRSRWPWRDADPSQMDPPGDQLKEFGPVGAPAWDKLDLGKGVFGLASNVMEWTNNWPTDAPGLNETGNSRAGQLAGGGSSAVFNGNPRVTPVLRPLLPVRLGEGNLPRGERKGVGLRCYRSLAPRTKKADFIRPQAGNGDNGAK